MAEQPAKLGSSALEQDSLRAAALWAAACAEQALPLFENAFPLDARPRQAIEGGRSFGRGHRRDKELRRLAWDAFAASQEARRVANLAAGHAAQAAMLTAAVAYTHTDLLDFRQTRHVLGPAVYAALALEVANSSKPGNEVIDRAVASAPAEVQRLVRLMPPQPEGRSRLSVLFAHMDAALRASQPFP